MNISKSKSCFMIKQQKCGNVIIDPRKNYHSRQTLIKGL